MQIEVTTVVIMSLCRVFVDLRAATLLLPDRRRTC